MSTHVLSLQTFRAQFPEFSDVVAYPDAMLTACWAMGNSYINPADGFTMSGAPLQLACDLMGAHLAKSFALITQGQGSVVVSGSSEGSVSVSLTPPPAGTGYKWWLSTTPYGLMLRSLLMARAGGGLMVGGSYERASFRKAAGIF